MKFKRKKIPGFLRNLGLSFHKICRFFRGTFIIYFEILAQSRPFFCIRQLTGSHWSRVTAEIVSKLGGCSPIFDTGGAIVEYHKKLSGILEKHFVFFLFYLSLYILFLVGFKPKAIYFEWYRWVTLTAGID